MAIRIATKSAFPIFPISSLIACTRHLKNNMDNIIWEKDCVTVDRKQLSLSNVRTWLAHIITNNSFLWISTHWHTNNRQRPSTGLSSTRHCPSPPHSASKSRVTTLTQTEASHDWTNKNCKSMNHIHKMKMTGNASNSSPHTHYENTNVPLWFVHSYLLVLMVAIQYSWMCLAAGGWMDALVWIAFFFLITFNKIFSSAISIHNPYLDICSLNWTALRIVLVIGV